MSAENILPVKGQKVTVGGRERLIRFTIKTMAILAERHGSVSNAMEIFEPMKTGQVTAQSLHNLAELVSAGFIYEDETATPEWVEKNLDMEEILEITPVLISEYIKAMGVKGGVKKKMTKG